MLLVCCYVHIDLLMYVTIWPLLNSPNNIFLQLTIVVSTQHAVLTLYHQILLQNELMITTKPNIIIIPLIHDSVIVSQLHISFKLCNKSKNQFVQWILYKQHKPSYCSNNSPLCCSVWICHYNEHQVNAFSSMAICMSIDQHVSKFQTLDLIIYGLNLLKFFLPNFLQSIFIKFYSQNFYYQRFYYAVLLNELEFSGMLH